MSRLGHAQLSLTITIRLKPAFNLHNERESWISFTVQLNCQSRYQQIITKYQRLQNACGKSHFILEFLGMSKYFLPFGILEVRVFMLIDGKFMLFLRGGAFSSTHVHQGTYCEHFQIDPALFISLFLKSLSTVRLDSDLHRCRSFFK